MDYGWSSWVSTANERNLPNWGQNEVRNQAKEVHWEDDSIFFLEEVLTDVQAWISKILNVGSGNSGKTKDEW